MIYDLHYDICVSINKKYTVDEKSATFLYSDNTDFIIYRKESLLAECSKSLRDLLVI